MATKKKDPSELQRRQLKALRTPVVKVVVTDEIIEFSTSRDSAHCMIAEAVRDAFPTAQKVSVDLQTIRFSDPEKRLRYIYLTPRTGQVALVHFDQGHKPPAFEFTLRRGQCVPMGAHPGKRKAATATAATATAAAEGAGTEVTPEGKAEPRGVAAEAQAWKKQISTAPSHIGRKDAALDITGGQAPPLGPFARRRQFGIRALEP